MKKYKYFLIVTLISAIASVSFAQTQKTGTTAAQVLNLM